MSEKLYYIIYYLENPALPRFLLLLIVPPAVYPRLVLTQDFRGSAEPFVLAYFTPSLFYPWIFFKHFNKFSPAVWPAIAYICIQICIFKESASN